MMMQTAENPVQHVVGDIQPKTISINVAESGLPQDAINHGEAVLKNVKFSESPLSNPILGLDSVEHQGLTTGKSVSAVVDANTQDIRLRMYQGDDLTQEISIATAEERATCQSLSLADPTDGETTAAAIITTIDNEGHEESRIHTISTDGTTGQMDQEGIDVFMDTAFVEDGTDRQHIVAATLDRINKMVGIRMYDTKGELVSRVKIPLEFLGFPTEETVDSLRLISMKDDNEKTHSMFELNGKLITGWEWSRWDNLRQTSLPDTNEMEVTAQPYDGSGQGHYEVTKIGSNSWILAGKADHETPPYMALLDEQTGKLHLEPINIALVEMPISVDRQFVSGLSEVRNDNNPTLIPEEPEFTSTGKVIFFGDETTYLANFTFFYDKNGKEIVEDGRAMVEYIPIPEGFDVPEEGYKGMRQVGPNHYITEMVGPDGEVRLYEILETPDKKGFVYMPFVTTANQ